MNGAVSVSRITFPCCVCHFVFGKQTPYNSFFSHNFSLQVGVGQKCRVGPRQRFTGNGGNQVDIQQCVIEMGESKWSFAMTRGRLIKASTCGVDRGKQRVSRDALADPRNEVENERHFCIRQHTLRVITPVPSMGRSSRA